jgi:threonine/homoserine/homoserine lactone efflux protein
MDVGIFIAIVMLLVWGVGTFFAEAPGWLHLLLTVGVFLLIWRIVVRGHAPSEGRAAAPRRHGKKD